MVERKQKQSRFKQKAISGASRANAGDNVVAYPGRSSSTGKKKESRYRSSKSSLRTKEAPLYIWGDFDMPFLLLVLALLGFGLVMLFSASYARAYYYVGSSSLLHRPSDPMVDHRRRRHDRCVLCQSITGCANLCGRCILRRSACA